jgi:DDE superfamily endonuclease
MKLLGSHSACLFLINIVLYLERNIVIDTAVCSTHSQERINIEHAFGVLKARWPSLRCLPVRIRTDIRKDHTRVIKWIMACLVLHNFLSFRGEDDTG